jgi:hypothetical protein
LFNAMVKLDPAKLGVEANASAIDIEVRAKIAGPVSFLATTKILKGKVHASVQDGVEVDASLFEAGVGAKIGPAKVKVLFGLSAGVAIKPNKVSVKAVVGVGGEVEVDPNEIAGYFGYEFDPTLLAGMIDPLNVARAQLEDAAAAKSKPSSTSAPEFEEVSGVFNYYASPSNSESPGLTWTHPRL